MDSDKESLTSNPKLNSAAGLNAIQVSSRGYFYTFMAQLFKMLNRNFILLKRYYVSTLSQVFLSPIAFLLVMFALQKAIDVINKKSIPHPESYPLGPLDMCQGQHRSDPCINIMYYPKSTDSDAIMSIFSNNNLERSGISSTSPFAINYEGVFDLDVNTPPKKKYGIVSISDENFLYNYCLINPNTTAFGISFETNKAADIYKYQIWFNTTMQRNDTSAFNTRVLGLIRGIDEAIIGYSGNGNAKIDVDLKDWPTVPPEESSQTIISTLGPMFLFSAQMVIFINFVLMLVTEKEKRLRESMQLAGLRSEVYWISWYLSYSALAFLCVLVTMAMGAALNLDVFRNANFFVLFFNFLLFNLAMLMVGCMLSAIINNSQTAVLVSVYIFVIGLILMGAVFSNPSFTYIWWDSGTSPAIRRVLMLLPPFNFGIMFVTVSNLASGSIQPITGTLIPGVGFKWKNLYENIPSSYVQSTGVNSEIIPVPKPVFFFYQLLINIVMYMALTWYMDNVVPNNFRVRKSPLFFFSPLYWRSLLRSNTTNKDVSTKDWLSRLKPSLPPQPNEDEDVTAERRSVLDSNIDYSLRIVDLHKTFGKESPFSTKFTAIDSTCLGIKEGEILALLGQNGAGKSTTMNILSGIMNQTSGDALFYGTPLRDQRSIRTLLGICPQHDILFDELNAVEHITLYGGLKGLSSDEIERIIEDGLNAVRLYSVRFKLSKTYSGGMKRRLSVLIATIGNPKVVFFDEPTTGMDPVNRRHVWRYLESFKKGRVIILTSHSMEEADVLSDRVAIMAHGRLRALGTSIKLKSKFGIGYRFSMIAKNTSSYGVIKNTISNLFPEAILEDDSAGSIIYNFPKENEEKIPEFVSWLEANQENLEDYSTQDSNGFDLSMTIPTQAFDMEFLNNPSSKANDDCKLISAWSMSQTSLEEVFLKIIREAQVEYESGNW
ncbi:ABC transporter A family member 2 [Smittium mucronatum]|uniref:ABC transporter A family member 2 n=1 Tax=Smittium mucronatum TaxID=133383 RepID=A0A1R0GW82_9FUNG|nr:ABC transporter A family member 2 [Smittium mucronatum]